MHNIKAVSQVYSGLLRTIAWETAPQIALRNCFKEVKEEVSIYVILDKEGTCNKAHISVEGCC